MVNQNQIEHARTLVQSSPSLTAPEREEWLSLLPFMSDKQLLELCTVLESRPEERVAVSPRRVPVRTSQPALPQPPEELDLPAPAAKNTKAAASSSAAKKPVSGQNQQNSVSAFIDRNFSAALHRTGGPVADIVPPPVRSSRPAPSAVPVSAPVAPIPSAPEQPATESSASTSVLAAASAPLPVDPAPAQPVWEEVVVRLKSLEDVRRLTVATLRAKGTEFLEEGLKSLGTRYGYFSVQLALEQSPLYQTYLSLGARVLQDHAQFESLQNELSAAGKPYLAKTEFEEMSDLLQRIKGG